MDRYRLSEELKNASEKGDINMIKTLLQNGTNIHAGDDIALRLASAVGHLDTVKYLVEQGADIHAMDDHAVRWAAEYGHLQVVKYLVEQGADINTKFNYALRKAAKEGHVKVVKYLIEQGADWLYIQDSPIFTEMLKQETNKLKNILTNNYMVLQQSSQIDIGDNIKYKMPKSLLLKSVYEAPYRQYCSNINGNIPPIQLIALANILQQNNKLNYNLDIYWIDLCDKIKHALFLLL